ncbi:MAG: acyl-CoA dehydrogenase [Solirubrobacterales bacterium]|jgi:alkylation response protein AidB-like acyl-CoA dehydrogenase|nr:acyl-CoA dehydrogenase [Solirubrobacterales bacterium]
MTTAALTSRLFNPSTFDAAEFDPATQRLFRATIDWFEAKGQAQIAEEVRKDEWYGDFIEFLASERAFAILLTPARDGAGDPDKRWDTARNAAFNEILGFYGLPYWYAWQVTILGLGPIWQSDNDDARARAAELLEDGAIFAFGLSERDHGADIYSTDMVLTPDGEGGFSASGGKYYIGNGNLAGMVSVFGRRADVDGPEGYVFFAADSAHDAYLLRKNVVYGQMYVSAFDLEGYPVRPEDILHTGPEAFEAALNTINVGKFNLGFCAIGMAEHCFYETVAQAEGRVLFGKRVTEFGQVRRILSEAYARLLATKLYGARAVDYVRSASREDRRYLLFTPINKMQVTMEGERIVSLLGEVISAKGYERDSYFESAKNIIGGLPKLEGTVHVNLALALKFLPGYLFGTTEFEPVPVRREPDDDAFLFAQGPTRGLSGITFANWRPAFDAFGDVPNVALFREQAERLVAMVSDAPLTPDQMKVDLDFQQALAQVFTLIPYGQLILEEAEVEETPADIVDLVFEWLVRDFSRLALDLHGKASSTPEQQEWVLGSIRKPVIDPEREDRIYAEVRALAGAYQQS